MLIKLWKLKTKFCKEIQKNSFIKVFREEMDKKEALDLIDYKYLFKFLNIRKFNNFFLNLTKSS